MTGEGTGTGGSQELLVRCEGGVLRLTMNRPGALNAVTDTLSDALAAEIEDAVTRDGVRVVLLDGAGGAFCAGADIAPGADGADAADRLDHRALDRANRVTRAILACGAPVVAAVDGVAAGVGCSMALACDLVVASPRSRFLLAFARIGLMPDGGATALVAASVGRARAMRMALLAEPLDATAAFEAGLVSHLSGEDDHAEVVAEVVARLAAGPPLALTATRRAVNAAALTALEDALERERTGQSVLLRTEDATEGMRAFGERRPAVFRGC